jgi:hypothetical protein
LEFDSSSPETEKWFKTILRAHVAKHGEIGIGGASDVCIERRLQALFNGSALMPAAEFDLELRMLIHKAVNEDNIFAEENARFNQGLTLSTELRAQA